MLRLPYMSGDGGDSDNNAALLALEMRHSVLAAVVGTLKIHVNQ
jgi:hypothetical protein